MAEESNLRATDLRTAGAGGSVWELVLLPLLPSSVYLITLPVTATITFFAMGLKDY